MDIQAIQQFLETNKDNDDVKAYLGKLSAPSLDSVKGFLESDEDGKKYLQSYTDAKVTKGIDTFKTNNLQKLIDEAVAKANPSETPEQKQLLEMQEKINQMEQEKTRESLKNITLTKLSEKKLPANLVDLLIGQDQETTLANLTKYEEVFTTSLQALVDEKLKNSGANIKDGNPPDNTDLSKLSPTQMMSMAYSQTKK